LRENSEGDALEIVEEKEATDEQKEIKEVYTGFLVARRDDLKRWLSQLSNKNAQAEYYLTDIVKMAFKEGLPILSTQSSSAMEVFGANSPLQLASLEAYLLSHDSDPGTIK
jgi:bifunctional UDP-N-acetylglucosamine pyrophosphorylase / glucosamine-1-phosphate N-acetyltransferase